MAADKPLIAVKGLDGGGRRFARAAVAMKAGSPESVQLLTRIGNLLVRQTHKWVDKEVDVDGKPFRSLSAKTANAPRRGESGETLRGFDHILRDFGTMMGSVQPKVTGNEVRVGPIGDIEQAKGWGHQLGIGVPKREWLGWRDGDDKEVFDEHSAWVAEVLRG